MDPDYWMFCNGFHQVSTCLHFHEMSIFTFKPEKALRCEEVLFRG